MWPYGHGDGHEDNSRDEVKEKHLQAAVAGSQTCSKAKHKHKHRQRQDAICIDAQQAIGSKFETAETMFVLRVRVEQGQYRNNEQRQIKC